MRLTLAAVVLGATVALMVGRAFAVEHADPTVYIDRRVTNGSMVPSGSVTARNPMDIYKELGQDNKSGR